MVEGGFGRTKGTRAQHLFEEEFVYNSERRSFISKVLATGIFTKSACEILQADEPGA